MKRISLALSAGLIGTVLAASSGADALACRGADEYPKVFAKLLASKLPEAMKAPLLLEYQKGKALHQAGHDENDPKKIEKSLKILDDVKKQLR
jgi:hypothetical protein